MSERRKVRKGEYAAFKRAFVRWQFVFGLQEYAVYFRQEEMDELATLTTDAANCVATVKVCLTVGDDEEAGWAEETGKHEAIHLLLARLMQLGQERWGSEEAIMHEEERVVRLLERLL